MIFKNILLVSVIRQGLLKFLSQLWNLNKWKLQIIAIIGHIFLFLFNQICICSTSETKWDSCPNHILASISQLNWAFSLVIFKYIKKATKFRASFHSFSTNLFVLKLFPDFFRFSGEVLFPFPLYRFLLRLWKRKDLANFIKAIWSQWTHGFMSYRVLVYSCKFLHIYIFL